MIVDQPTMPSNNLKMIKRVMTISLFISAVVATILLLNYIQITTSEPVDHPSLQQLREQLSMDGNNEVLRNQIRQLDLMIRKAYFVKQSQLKIGGYLLALSLIVFCVSGNIYYYHRKRYTDLSHGAETPNADKESLLNYLLTAFGVAIFAGLGFFALEQSKLELGSDTAVADTGQTKEAEPAKPQFISVEELSKNWVTMRGTDNLGVGFDTTAPTSWNEEENKNIIWKIKTSRQGFSSPLVWEDKVFLTAGDRKARSVYCYNIADGKQLWEHKAENIPNSPEKPPKVTEDTGYAAATPAIDGERIFSIFATGDVVCVDFDGNRVWARNIGLPENSYGYATSLVTYNDKLIIQYDNDNDQFLLALDTKTGKPVWKANRTSETSWATPLIVRHEDKGIIILNSLPKVSVYDADTGKMMWEQECMNGEIAASPAYEDGVVFVCNEGASLFAFDLLTGKQLWENDEVTMPDASSPLAYKGYIYLATDAALLTCVNAKTGEMVWEHESEEGFYSSPIAVNGKIYACDKEGRTHIFEPAAEYTSAGEGKIDEPIVTTPASANGSLYIRSMTHLYRVGGTK